MVSLRSSSGTIHTLYVGDSRDLSFLEIGEVQLILTSPPYWAARDVGHHEKLGFERDFEDYLDGLVRVLRKGYVLLRPGGAMVLVLADGRVPPAPGAPPRWVGLHARVVGRLLQDPWMTLHHVGSLRRGPTAAPADRPRRPRRDSPEYAAVLLKSDGRHPVVKSLRSRAVRSIHPPWERSVETWFLPRHRSENPSAFPLAIPLHFIRSLTSAGDVVFDPFVGGGTTMVAAARLGRDSVGVESGFPTRSGRPFSAAVREAVLAEGGPWTGQRVSFRRIGGLAPS